MDTVFYNGKKYMGIKMPFSEKVKLYSADSRYKGRYVTTVNESELDKNRKTV